MFGVIVPVAGRVSGEALYSPRMRGLLVVNPKATTASERHREVLRRALGSQLDLHVQYTRRRGHAAVLARRAVDERMDVVVTLGGDGTVNEVVNGLLHAGPGEHVPALAAVPGGLANVFTRALGLPKDTFEATGAILEALQEGRVRSIGLGRADERYFTFCAGFGIDAEVVRAVEQARLRGRRARASLYLRMLATRFLFGAQRRTPALTLEVPGEEPEAGIAAAIIQNTSPWTYLGARAVDACPGASFDTGLDLMAMRGLNVATAARTGSQILSRRRQPHGKSVIARHDLDRFTLRSSRPLAFQLDGDYIGDRLKVDFCAVPNAIHVYC